MDELTNLPEKPEDVEVAGNPGEPTKNKVGRPTQGLFEARLELYKEKLSDLEFVALPIKDQAESFGVTVATIFNWRNKFSTTDWEKIRENGRKQYAKDGLKIDSALIKKAQSGDTKAIELFYQRFDNWSIKTIVENLNKNEVTGMSNEDLIMEILKSAKPEQLKKALDAVNEKPVA